MDGGRRRRSEKPYNGIWMRKWGKWVAEIREPNKLSRIWLSSYNTPVAKTRAYNTAVFYLCHLTTKLNFPDHLFSDAILKDLSTAAIKEKAVAVGANVDALQESMR
ncbi:ethylene-responsive transcription factor ERF010-like [Andrographis paniculata]|uniref:ethylene-responsive transcription factor ERF010-like n=1 Tax=Andrographis paniculata TaxID=175694 RepID=UPI0021E76DC0|nr:ethylene-responsive transcription factor ERF010-like [Andrographis paniculata]